MGHPSQVGMGIPPPSVGISQNKLGGQTQGRIWGSCAPLEVTKNSVLKFNVRKIMLNFEHFWKGTGPSPNPPRRLRHLDPSHSKILGTPLGMAERAAEV